MLLFYQRFRRNVGKPVGSNPLPLSRPYSKYQNFFILSLDNMQERLSVSAFMRSLLSIFSQR